MSDTKPASPLPRWFAAAVLGLLGLQLALGWIQGAMLNRQHQDLVALRDEIQNLTDSLDESASAQEEEDYPLAPLGSRRRTRRRALPVACVRLQDESSKKQEEEARGDRDAASDSAAKDLKEAKDSALKAVEKARDTQSKLSIEENYRKAEEKKKLEAAEGTWAKWAGLGLAITFLALVIRSWLRRRG